jgi:aconitate hydratase
MGPEYGATMGFSLPMKNNAIYAYDRQGQEARRYGKRIPEAAGLFVTEDSPEPVFTHTLELDMGTVEPCLAGPKRPQDRILLSEMPKVFHKAMKLH